MENKGVGLAVTHPVDVLQVYYCLGKSEKWACHWLPPHVGLFWYTSRHAQRVHHSTGARWSKSSDCVEGTPCVDVLEPSLANLLVQEFQKFRMSEKLPTGKLKLKPKKKPVRTRGTWIFRCMWASYWRNPPSKSQVLGTVFHLFQDQVGVPSKHGPDFHPLWAQSV